MIDLTPEQEGAVSGPITEPQYLMQIDLDQPYFWSTRQNATFNDDQFVRSELQLGQITNDTANFQFRNEGCKFSAAAEDGVFHRNRVRIWWAYGPKPGVYYVDPGYWDPGYTVEPDSDVPDPILLFDGLIYSMPVIDDWISVVARRTAPTLFPRKIIRPPIANHLPSPGYSVAFDGAILQIQE